MEGQHPQTIRALIAALHPDADVFAAAAAAPEIDWGWVLDQAQPHKVEALVASRLRELGLASGLDGEVQRRIDEAQRAADEGADRTARTLTVLATVLGDAGIDYFVIKGSVLAHEVYGAAQRRRFSDLDIVLHAADVERTEAILQRLGFRFGIWMVTRDRLDAAERAAAEEIMRGFARRRLGAHDWVAPAGDPMMSVDVHWQITPDRLPRDEAHLWTQLRSVRVGSAEVRTLAPPAALLHLAAHVTRHFLANFRLLHLCDLAWAVRRYADDLPAMWQLAEHWRMRIHLERVFAMIEQVLQIPMPRHPEDDSGQVRHVAGIDLPFLLPSPNYARAPLTTRLIPELRWASAMRSLRVNVSTFTDISLGRVRFERKRRALRKTDKRLRTKD